MIAALLLGRVFEACVKFYQNMGLPKSELKQRENVIHNVITDLRKQTNAIDIKCIYGGDYNAPEILVSLSYETEIRPEQFIDRDIELCVSWESWKSLARGLETLADKYTQAFHEASGIELGLDGKHIDQAIPVWYIQAFLHVNERAQLEAKGQLAPSRDFE